MAIERILVPLDGSDLAEAALETALELVSEQPSALLVLLRAAEAPTSVTGNRMEERARLVGEAETYLHGVAAGLREAGISRVKTRSEEHTSELQSRGHLVCRLLLEKKK